MNSSAHCTANHPGIYESRKAAMDDQTIKVEAVHFDVAADEVAAGGHEVKSETQVEQVFVDCGFENGEEEGANFHESQVGTT